MLLADVARTSEAVAATSARTTKIAIIADLLRGAEPHEVEVAVALLTGEPRQGRIGVGWRTLIDLAPTPAPQPVLTITDLDVAITAIAAVGGAGSVHARRAELEALFAAMTASEREFVFRLFTGGLRQGALEGVMVDAVAQAANIPATVVRRACMLAGDLPHVAGLALAGGASALHDVGLTVLRPVLPMLATTAASTDEAVAATGLSSVEWKLDGIRVQAHRSGDEVRLYTRNLNDVTDRFPALVDLLRSLPVDSIVLDGEIVGDEVRFFDCLHLDGADLLDEPLTDRRAALERIAGPWCIPTVLTADGREAALMLEAALAAGHEGVMVKGAASVYEAGRRGKAWRKVKPVLTLDLVVLGAEWGHGRRRGWLSNLHLGARNRVGGFVMVGKTFKGLTDELLTWQTEQFLTRETERDGIVVFIRPELVVEIALDGVQRSTRYAGGVALRFARVRRYRDDKGPEDTDTIDAVRTLLPGTSR